MKEVNLAEERRQVATRRFGMADQLSFAALSGDYNPMHVDALAARRTQAGAPVVHGMHAVLWALDALAGAELIGPATWGRWRSPRWAKMVMSDFRQ